MERSGLKVARSPYKNYFQKLEFIPQLQESKITTSPVLKYLHNSYFMLMECEEEEKQGPEELPFLDDNPQK